MSNPAGAGSQKEESSSSLVPRVTGLDERQETYRPAAQTLRRGSGQIPALLIASAVCLFAQTAEWGRSAAIVEGEAISEQAVNDEAGPQIRQLANQAYDVRSRVLKNIINQKFLHLAAKRGGLDPEAFLKAEADSKGPSRPKARWTLSTWDRGTARIGRSPR